MKEKELILILDFYGQYNQLIAEGKKYLQSDNISKLREIYGQLISLKIYSNDNFMDEVNILRG